MDAGGATDGRDRYGFFKLSGYATLPTADDKERTDKSVHIGHKLDVRIGRESSKAPSDADGNCQWILYPPEMKKLSRAAARIRWRPLKKVENLKGVADGTPMEGSAWVLEATSSNVVVNRRLLNENDNVVLKSRSAISLGRGAVRLYFLLPREGSQKPQQ
ncbi:unnamed protein product [Vitrella brassicaformis CCMP3155]|uniref:FHA domain-containing protein n=1 Tax=Vitrella brassicaformis (strain CCMP3155) TaxID=1169540 RepID=A0A0G4F2D1_VITBC|nr:unnamed protein product [Vitrella brassicaformis CCMP3155]|eukprot:CEM05530.1 unnamed protein product [Vitrella brassicaformis CCMP3155]